MLRAKTTSPDTSNNDAPAQETPDEGAATLKSDGAGNHADAMEPYGDELANSDQVSVHGPTNGAAVVTAPTGAQLPAHTGGIDPEGPVAANGDAGAQGYSRDAPLRIASDNDVTVPDNATSEDIVALLDGKYGKPTTSFGGSPVTAKPAPKTVKIYAPNEAYTGISAGVAFVNGVGETHESSRLEWFRERGYKVEGDPEGEGDGDKDAE